MDNKNNSSTIAQQVYDSLRADTADFGKLLAERDTLQEKARAGRYSAKAMVEEIMPQLAAVKETIRTASAAAIDKAKGLVDEYRQESDKLNSIDLKELAEPSAAADLGLLKAGLPLTARDIADMLERNADNRSMRMLIHRYAGEHGIDLPAGAVYPSNADQLEKAKVLDFIIDRYAGWIDGNTGIGEAQKTLTEFFKIMGVKL